MKLDYTMKEITFSIIKANLYGLLISLIILLPVIFLYSHLNGLELKFLELTESKIIFLVLGSLLSIALHELLHALFFLIFSRGKFKSVKIGFIKQYLTPYAHCSEPLLKLEYAIVLIAPLFFLGIIPIVVAFYLKDILVLFYSLIMISAASVDVLLLFCLLKIPNHKKILDHEDKAGFLIIN